MKNGMSIPPQMESFVRQLLGRQYLRLTPVDLLRQMSVHFPQWDRKSLRIAIRQMVAGRILSYSHHFSSTHIELAISAAPPLSQRLTLNDPSIPWASDGEGFHLSLQDGAAFGRGDHPTTRLAIQAIDWISERAHWTGRSITPRTLDIGTGTGLLAMAAAMLSHGKAIGIDIDYLSCCEAMANIRSNDLTGSVHIVAGDLAAIRPVPFDLILANLRPPTLAALLPQLGKYTSAAGYWVLTGFRPKEKGALLKGVPRNLAAVWDRLERNWAAVVVQSVKMA